MASNNTASIAQARKLVEQLKMEANIDRIKVSRQDVHGSGSTFEGTMNKLWCVLFVYFLNIWGE